MLDGPGAHIVEGLTAMAAAGDWNNLATTAWQTSAQFPLWLDAIKLMVDAMENLGSDYDVARVVVARELAALIARAPEIVELKFADGTAFAGPDTKQWISTLAGGAGGGGGRSPVDKAAVEAEKLAAEDKLPQAVAVLSRVATQSASPVYKFRARLEISKLCLKFGQLDIAKAQLEGLERVAEEHRLAAWDPELCAQMYANLYRVRRALTASIDDAELHKKVAQSLERLCELDAAEAFRLMQEGAG
jgi:type VI secretion system protein VasJ